LTRLLFPESSSMLLRWFQKVRFFIIPRNQKRLHSTNRTRNIKLLRSAQERPFPGEMMGRANVEVR